MILLCSLTGHYVPRVVDGGAAVNVNAYPGTKHAVTAITEVLQMEMRHAGLKIKVTVIVPLLEIVVNFAFCGYRHTL